MKKILLLLMALCCWSSPGLWAQVASYSFSQTMGTYTPITGGTVLVDGTTLTGNYTSANISMPAFTYNELVVSTFSLESRGLIRLGSPYTGTLTPFLSTLAAVNNTAASNIRYEVIGNETVIQWTQFKRQGCTESFDFQVRLNTTDGSVRYVYQLNMVPDVSVANQPLVGLGTNTSQFNYRTVSATTGDWDASALATTSSERCRFTGNATNPRYFTTGLTYTWTPSSCPFGLGTLSVTNQTATSVSVAWQAANSGSYLLEYGPSGFTPGSGNTPGTNGTVVEPAVLPLTLSGLNTNTNYDIYYRKNCTASSNGYSINSQIAKFKTGYCSFSSVNPNYYIRNLSTVGGRVNVSNLNSGYSPTGYRDTTSTMFLEQNSGDSVSLSLTYVGGANTNIVGIWIDWDNDCIFENDEEIPYIMSVSSEVRQRLLIPAGTATGAYRMRVSFTYYAFLAQACGSFNGTASSQPGGEAEDYMIYVTNSSCKRPVNITPGFPTDNSFSLSWNNNGVTPSNNYDIYYSTDSIYPVASTLPTLTNQVSGVTINGLAPNTTYYVWIRANCGAEQSSWGWVKKVKTACTPVSDYFEGFGLSNTTTMPPCFDALGQGGVSSGLLNVGGSGAVSLRPVTNAGANTHWLRFSMRTQLSGYVLQLGYLTDPLDSSTFTLLQQITSSVAGGVPATAAIDPGTFASTNGVLAFRSTNSISIDSLYWEPKPGCLPPFSISVTQPTDTSCYLAWSSPAVPPSGNFDVYYSTANVAPTGVWVPNLLNQTSGFTLSGLASNTNYYFWIRSNCGAGLSSTWAPGGSIKTYCTPLTSFSENFDNAIPPPQGGSPPLQACFKLSNNVVSAGGYSAPYCVALGNTATLGLRPVANASANTHWLRYKAAASSSAVGNSVIAGYLTDPFTLSSFVPFPQQPVVKPTATYAEYFVDPGTAPGTNIVLALKVTGPNVINAFIRIDDIVWEPKPSCIFVTNVAAGVPTQTTDTIKWQVIASQPPSNNYDIYYSTDTTTPVAATLPTLSNQVPGAVLTGLTQGTTYYAWVRSNCASSQTIWTGPATFTTAYAQLNDDATGAISLTLGAGCTGNIYHNLGATTTASEPYPYCSNGKVAPVWFKLKAPASGALRVYSTTGTANTSKIALFSATDSSNYSTFSLVSCDGQGGSATGTLSNGSNGSVMYATGLIPGMTYYVAFDLFFTNDVRGTFCLQAEEFSGNMVSSINTCSSGYQGISSTNTGYVGWYTLLDNNGKITAMVKQPTGGSPNYFSGAQNVNNGSIRTDGAGTPYLDRNWYIRNTTSTASTDVQLFFTDAEFQALKTADPSINTLNDLFVIKVPHATNPSCMTNFGTGQVNSVLTPTGNGTSADGLVHWLRFTTPSFSNFFIKGGNTPLPVQLVDFKGSKGQGGNLLSWNFACDDNELLQVTLERNSDGKSQFVPLQQSVIDGSNCGTYVTYLDRNPKAATNYYRLRYAEKDGKAKYSKVIALTSDSKAFELIGVVPNPARSSATLSLVTGSDTKASLRITDVAGRVVQSSTVALSNGSNTIELNTSALAPGLYILSVADESSNKRSLKFVKE